MQSVIVKGSFLGFLGGALLLAGCGGGGGGGGSTFTPPNIPNTPVAIDSSNQYEVANAAVNGVTGTVDGGGGALGVVVESNGRSFSAFDFVKKTVLDLTNANVALTIPSPVGVSYTSQCDVAPDGTTGTMVLSTNVPDLQSAGAVTAGDYVSMSYNNCYDVYDATISNGKTTLSIVSGTLDFTLADPFTGTLSISASFDNMQTTEVGGTSVMHGGVTISVNGTAVTMSGDSLYVLEAGGESAHITDFVMTSTTSGTIESVTVDMTLASTEINGVVRVQTDPSNPLLQDQFEDHPYAGTLIITGGTTTLTLVIGSADVELTLDADGVAGPDAGYPMTVTWTEIDNGAATL